MFPVASWSAIAPLLILTIGGCSLLLFEAFAEGKSRRHLMWFGLLAVALAFMAALRAWPEATSASESFAGMIVNDRFALLSQLVFLIGGGLTLLLSPGYLEAHRIRVGEFYPLVLFSLAGMCMLAQAGDFVSFLIGLEVMSVSAYVLTGCVRASQQSGEAAFKYYLSGAIATAFLIYGIALVYGATGETSFMGLAQKVPVAVTQPIFVIGFILILVALGFKVSAVPFHMWAPDAYEGAPTPATGFMAATIKSAGFVGLMRILLVAFGATEVKTGPASWLVLFSTLAVLTMSVANLSALKQQNIKRLLAYSSIAHAGYLLIGVVTCGVLPEEGKSAIFYYLFAYTFSTMGVFGVVSALGRKGDEQLLLDDWAGLGKRHPALALAMTIFLCSLGGIPPTAGFFAKFYLFRAALSAAGSSPALMTLVLVAIANSLISIYYYLRIVTAMYFREPIRQTNWSRALPTALAIGISAVMVLQMGLQPGRYLGYAAKTLLGRGVETASK